MDAQPHRMFNQRYIDGSFALPFSDNFATWIGWVVPWLGQVILLSQDPADHYTMVRQLIRIGYDWLSGFLAGGMDGSNEARLPAQVSNRLDID